jgi:spore coat protein A
MISTARRALIGLALLAICYTNVGAAPLQDAAVHPKFELALPLPARIDATHGGQFEMDMMQTQQWLGLRATNGKKIMTTVWGYGPTGGAVTYPGPTFIAERDVMIQVLWQNKLPRRHLLPVDTSLHWANPSDGGIASVTHLHGGHTESASDGLPEAWFTQGFNEVGPHFVKQNYRYDNDQEGATLWYHDHALGITRLNVYAGLAGFYLLRDDNEAGLIDDDVLPSGIYEREIVIQDRQFDRRGRLALPTGPPDVEVECPLPDGRDCDRLPNPSGVAEFFGDYILVNGVTWPNLDVERRKYRLRMLNGSDSRFYVLELRDDRFGGEAQEFLQIGTDNGFLERPVEMTQLLLGPGERADLVVDFSQYEDGDELYWRNFGPDNPFKGFVNGELDCGDDPPGSCVADVMTTGQIMRFSVEGDEVEDDVSVDAQTKLRSKIAKLKQDGATRQLVLFEGLDNYGRLQPLLGTLEEGSLAWFAPITENPMVDDVEVWEVYNATEDAHPIHLHLVAFQIIGREGFTGDVIEKDQPQHDGSVGIGGKLLGESLVLDGKARDPGANEDGWKDTVVALPGEVTRVIAHFDREGRYVWHCHILSHEDHEMMRPYYVGPMPANGGPHAKTAGPSARMALEQNQPNPFNPMTQIRFSLERSQHAKLRVFDVAGRLVRTLADREFAAGQHVMLWDGKDDAGLQVSSGVYFYRLLGGERVLTRRMVVLR